MISLFLDTSAVIASLASATGGSRELMRLGESGAVTLTVSTDVLSEAESVVRRKLPHGLDELAETLIRARIETVPSATPTILRSLKSAISYAQDRAIVGAAVRAGVDYFVSFDRKHLIGNHRLMVLVPFPIGTAANFLDWYRKRLIA